MFGTKMNVLFITHHYLNGSSGAVFASRAFINAVAEIADKTILLYPYKKGNEKEFIDCNVNCIPVEYKKSKVFKFFDLLFGRVHRYYDIFENTLSRNNIDVVIFDTSIVAFNLIEIARRYNAKVITIHHNYQYEYFSDSTKDPLKPIVLYWTKRYEEYAVTKSDLNLTLTEQDKLLLAQNYNGGDSSTIKVLGCFDFHKDCEGILKSPSIESENKEKSLNFVITASLDAYQNKISIIPWIEHYYPILKETLPDATLTLAGRNPTPEYYSVCEKYGVRLIPSPKDINEIISSADFYLCPMDKGGGLKLRVLDGLKNGLLVVTHKVSARGYDEFVSQKCMFCYDDEQSFIEALKNVVESNYSKNDILKLYDGMFSFKSGVNRLNKYVASLFSR